MPSSNTSITATYTTSGGGGDLHWEEQFSNGAGSASDETSYTVNNSSGTFGVSSNHFLVKGNGGQSDTPFGTWTSEVINKAGKTVNVYVTVGGDANGQVQIGGTAPDHSLEFDGAGLRAVALIWVTQPSREIA
mgnify:CR=1 FL=1